MGNFIELGEYKCPKCEGQLEYIEDNIFDWYAYGKRCKCKYCDSIFSVRIADKSRDIPGQVNIGPSVRIEMIKPGFEVIKTCIAINSDIDGYLTAKEKEEYVKRHVARSIADYLVEHFEDFIDMDTELDTVYCMEKIHARVRIANSSYSCTYGGKTHGL